MCGIIGYTGYEGAKSKIKQGLEYLEYRGYDSAGVKIGKSTVKATGRVENLSAELEKIQDAKIGMGHTRWATHGAATKENAHPHTVGKITIVHNGIIENFVEMKSQLQGEGYTFKSSTDTEVACGIINKYYLETNDIRKAILKAVGKMRGSYAFCVMVEGDSETLYAIRQKSPLLIAKGRDGNYVASDITALLPFTKKFYRLKENELAEITPAAVKLYNAEISTPMWELSTLTAEGAKKQGYEHFMMKEIAEQDEAIMKTATPRIENDLVSFKNDGLPDDYFCSFDAVQIIACGSAMHAGLIGKHYIEKLSKVPTSVYIASEYRYRPPAFRGKVLGIFISQSGETADTIASLELAKEMGISTLAIVNTQESTVAREAEKVIYTYAGQEIAVATTKGYTTQSMALILIAIRIGYEKNVLTLDKSKELCHLLREEAPKAVKIGLDKRSKIKEIANTVCKSNDVFFIGRGLDYYLCMEGSLKLKEISYIHSEAYPAGELKHGTISLIEEGTPVIAIATEKDLYEKTESNLREVRARGALTALITNEASRNKEHTADLQISLSSKLDFFECVVILQLLAYEIARERGCDIDKPRNLAKSVTVE